MFSGRSVHVIHLKWNNITNGNIGVLKDMIDIRNGFKCVNTDITYSITLSP